MVPLAESILRKYMDDAVDRSFGIRYENGHFMMGDKILKIYGDNIMLDNEVYLVLKRTPKKTMRDTKSYCMKPMLCIVTMTLKVVILELTDQRNGRKFCDQYGKSSTNMGRVPPIREEFHQYGKSSTNMGRVPPIWVPTERKCTQRWRWNIFQWWWIVYTEKWTLLQCEKNWYRDISQTTSYVSWCLWKWSLHSERF